MIRIVAAKIELAGQLLARRWRSVAEWYRNGMNGEGKVGDLAENLVVEFLGAAAKMRGGGPASVRHQAWIVLLPDRARHCGPRVNNALPLQRLKKVKPRLAKRISDCLGCQADVSQHVDLLSITLYSGKSAANAKGFGATTLKTEARIRLRWNVLSPARRGLTQIILIEAFGN